MTMKLVNSVTVGAGGTASITFSGIPQDATDLVLLVSMGDSGGNQNCYMLFNGSNANFSSVNMYGTGDAVGSNGRTDNVFQGLTSSLTAASAPSAGQISISNYASSLNKTFLIDTTWENTTSTAFQWLTSGRWLNTAAINSITLTATNLFTQYSIASLYTITKGSGGASAA